MNITSENENMNCANCGLPFECERLSINGKQIHHSGLCEPCEDKHRYKVERKERLAKAESKWVDIVPAVYRNTDIQHPDYQAQFRVHKICMQWIKGEDIGEDGRKLFLGLIGDSGICKTRIVSQIVKVPIWRGKGVCWVNSSQFQWACQNLHNDSERGRAAQCLKSCRDCSVLVLDDIGSLKATEVVSDNLYAILEHRTGFEKPMIWTSNETLDEMLPGTKITEKAKKRNISRLAGYSNIINL